MKKSALTQTAEDYASRSSIHGIGYVFDKDLNIIDRLLWFFLVLVFSGVAAALTLNFWTQWRNEQVTDVRSYYLCVGEMIARDWVKSCVFYAFD